MNPILILVPIVCAIVYIAVMVATRLALKRTAPKVNRKAIAIVVGIITVVVSFPSLVRWIQTADVVIGADSSTAERHLKRWGLPPNVASDFCYRFSPTDGGPIIADFKMTEADYLSWMQAQRLKPNAIDAEYRKNTLDVDREVTPVRQFEAKAKTTVDDGWRTSFEDPPGTSDWTIIVYDKNSGRVFFEHIMP